MVKRELGKRMRSAIVGGWFTEDITNGLRRGKTVEFPNRYELGQVKGRIWREMVRLICAVQ
ncbi:MAG: hypothetical protein JWQ42_1121 [Edaphobacter sp.]|nr:hypothetical protein [Edaphobacter sp.]